MYMQNLWQAKLLTLSLAAVCCAPLGAQEAAKMAAPPAAATAGRAYSIGFGDILQIVVFKEPDASVPETAVRSDGKISVPFIGEVEASGLTPSDLEKSLTEKFLPYIKNPEVAVLVKLVQSEKVVIVGQVRKGGPIRLGSSMTVLEALSEAGLGDFAKPNGIYVLRTESGNQVKMPFRYKDVIAGKHLEQNVRLKPGDTIVVP
jgi:polysaccharide biosynthesis/export protein